MGFEGVFFQQLTFQRCKEALRHRVIKAISDRSHGWSYPQFPAAIAEGDRGVLDALIGVMDDLMRASLCVRSVQRVQHQVGSEVILQRPPHNATAVHIQHDRQVHEARQVGM